MIRTHIKYAKNTVEQLKKRTRCDSSLSRVCSAMNRTQKHDRCKSAEHLAECMPPGPMNRMFSVLDVPANPLTPGPIEVAAVVDIVSSLTMAELRRDG